MNSQSQDYMLVVKGRFGSEAMPHFAKWAQDLMAQGKYKDCARPGSENRRVLVQDGSTIVDGPFSETKEIISGAFFVVAKDIDEATELAKKCPVLRFGGSVEVFNLTDNRIS